MEQEILNKLKALEEKIDAIYISAEKTRKYFKWTFIATIVFFVLPLIMIAVILPSLMSGITNYYGAL